MLGIEADIQDAGIDASGTVNGQPNKSRLDWFGTVRGRVGYAADNALIYFTGGLAFGGVDDEAVAKSIPTLFTSDETRTGYVLGGGVEYKFNHAWSVKAEYQFLNFGKEVPLSAAGAPIPTPAWTVRDDAFHTVRVGLNYHVQPAYEPLK